MECAICLNKICDSYKELPCSHKYHKECINKWSAKTCPLCREPFDLYDYNVYRDINKQVTIENINENFLFLMKVIYNIDKTERLKLNAHILVDDIYIPYMIYSNYISDSIYDVEFRFDDTIYKACVITILNHNIIHLDVSFENYISEHIHYIIE